MKEIITESMKSLNEAIGFSGTALARNKDEILVNFSSGYANRSEGICNRADTRFGIASGCKLFTAVAICQLVEKGQLSYDSRLQDCLPLEFKHFDPEITIHHLLTHTSGIPDYFDEETMDNFEDLWTHYPMYRVRRPQDFLPLFADKKMKHEVGRVFHYNNGGYIVLGLVVEHLSGLAFSDYVEKFIFAKAGMMDSGYFEADCLPERTAAGYIDQEDGSWKTNVFSLPAKGGPDGGAYVTAPDMTRFWESLMTFELLSEETTAALLQPHVHITNDIYYGYGLRMKLRQQDVEKYILMGYDPGVNFRSVYYPEEARSIVVCSNKSGGAFEIISGIEQECTGQKRG